MGIRFYCPNGHKLNVKEFQAGRKGICPYCGARIEVPTESTRPPSKKKTKRGPKPQGETTAEVTGSEAGGDAPALASGPGLCVAAGQPGNEPVVGDTVELPAAEMPRPGPPGAPPLASPATFSSPQPSPEVGVRDPLPAPANVVPMASSEPPSFDSSEVAASEPAAAGPARPASPAVAQDPIAEAGDVVWYVRPASGGQFGPAGGEVMRSWLEQGRVGADSLVWREGWPDWRQAAQVFPQLGASQAGPPLCRITVGEVARTDSAVHRRSANVRRQSKHTQTVVLTLLIVTLIILTVVLIWVLSG